MQYLIHKYFCWKQNVSSFCKCKSYSHFFSKNISVYAIFDYQSFNDTLTNDIVSFEQLGPVLVLAVPRRPSVAVLLCLCVYYFLCGIILPLFVPLFPTFGVSGYFLGSFTYISQSLPYFQRIQFSLLALNVTTSGVRGLAITGWFSTTLTREISTFRNISHFPRKYNI